MERNASVKYQIQRSENTKDAGLHFRSSRSNLSKVTNTLLEVKNRKKLSTTTLSQNISTIVHDYTDSLALRSLVNTHSVNTATLAWLYWILPRQSKPRNEKKRASWFRNFFSVSIPNKRNTKIGMSTSISLYYTNWAWERCDRLCRRQP